MLAHEKRLQVLARTYMLLPAKTPADPKPLKARPTMNAVELGADAATMEPMTKMKNDTI